MCQCLTIRDCLTYLTVEYHLDLEESRQVPLGRILLNLFLDVSWK